MTNPALVPPLAIERYRTLEPHLIDGIPLADLARAVTVSERTLQRWLARYRSEGLAGLARISRADRGRLHLPDHLVALIRDLAIKRPHPPVAAIHRKVQELAVAEGHRAPSYSVVARVVRAIPASRIAVASDPAAYRDKHELVHRREAATSNEMWQADHTPKAIDQALAGSGEQVADRAHLKSIEPPASTMFGGVMDHMATLAERGEVARPVVAGIMVQVRAGKDHARDAQMGGRVDARESRLRPRQIIRRRQAANPPALPVAPACRVLVPPDAIAEVQHVAAVRAPAMLTTSLGAAKPDDVGQLAPVDRIEPAMFARDRHDDSMSQPRVERKRKTAVIQIYHHR